MDESGNLDFLVKNKNKELIKILIKKFKYIPKNLKYNSGEPYNF